MKKIVNFAEELWEAIKEAGYFVFLALRALRFWHRDPPVLNIEDLRRFAETRSKFVSQITLFGYIKTRAGTRYTSLFEDDLYAQSINIAKWEIYLACLGDLSVYSAAKVVLPASSPSEETCALAIHIFETSLHTEELPKEKPHGFDDEIKAFHSRVRLTDWPTISQGENSFASSLTALVEWAPIADELKARDADIVRNSMRFRWKTVRDQLDTLLQSDAVITDWRSGKNTQTEN